MELQQLAPFAVFSRYSKGRYYQERQSDTRTCFQRDRDRIVHSKAFRRLKHKTQVFVATESDHYRSRLTHTLEVAQIGRHISRMLRLNEDLTESIALSHDLGHTPFGHSGERVLNQLMTEFGGFEHNRQSRRIVDELETKYPLFPGLNLSFEVREGLMKHSTPWDPAKSQERVFVSLEAQVCNIADEIAYNNHDIDDGLRSKLLDEPGLAESITLWRRSKEKIKALYTNLEDYQMIHLVNSDLISEQITDAVNTSIDLIKESGIRNVADLQTIERPLIRFSQEMAILNKEMRAYLYNQFYTHPTVYRMNRKGQGIITRLFEAFVNDTKLLPKEYQDRISSGKVAERVVADYIAGMTDPFATKEYQAIYQ
ncbi:deoxyguanosinetriphosphate triphosphohydrolase [bacterium]|nr:deoxyguanosinetriphosphate triphosphohydrolase [bacterium]